MHNGRGQQLFFYDDNDSTDDAGDDEMTEIQAVQCGVSNCLFSHDYDNLRAKIVGRHQQLTVFVQSHGDDHDDHDGDDGDDGDDQDGDDGDFDQDQHAVDEDDYGSDNLEQLMRGNGNGGPLKVLTINDGYYNASSPPSPSPS